jgi:hypothetical protein
MRWGEVIGKTKSEIRNPKKLEQEETEKTENN